MLTPFQLAQALAALGETYVREGPQAHLEGAARLLSRVSPSFIISELLAEPETLLDQLYGWFHLGFLVVSSDFSELPARAVALGFGAYQSRFQSEVMTLELSARHGSSVETHVFQGFHLTDLGTTGLEAFSPKVEEETARTWVEDGLGVHLGIGLREARAVERAQKEFAEVGFLPATFLRGRPAENRAEDIQVLYLDGELEGVALRLEFYHSGSQLKLAARCSASATGEA